MKKASVAAVAAFLSAAAFAGDAVYVIPTPAEMTVGAGEVAAGGVEVAPCAGVPKYALERLGEFAGKGLAFTFARDAALGEQAYRLEVGPDGVTATANDDRGFIYAVSSFRQLVRRTPNGLRVPHVRICDKPAFETRGTCWDLLVEHGNWGYDDGDGAEAIYRRTLDGLDMLADFKLNAVFFDGMGWCPERFPGYGRLMRRISAAARADAAKRPAAEAALDALAQKADALHADYTAVLGKMTDPEGGFVRPALLTVEYVQKEVANIRHSFATGEFLPHPRERMW